MGKKLCIHLGMSMILLATLICGSAYSAEITVNAGESIQAALDAAVPGDTVIISAGIYQEDISIGDLNAPGNRKDDITLKAADGASVEIKIPQEANHLAGLAALGADFGAADRMGFIIYGDNVVIEGIKFTQISGELNNYDVSSTVTVLSSNVTFKNCEFDGLGVDVAGDAVGLAVTPLDGIALMAGEGGVATNLLVENCTFHDLKYPYGNVNFLQQLGLSAPSPESTVTGCEFFNNGTCINMDDGVANITNCHFHDNLGTAIDASDDGIIVYNCIIETSGEHGIEISNAASEEDEAEGNPVVIIEDCVIADNGTDDSHNGINIEHGTLTVKNTIIRGNSGANVFFKTETGRLTTAVFEHCDIYNSQIGTAIETVLEPKDVIDLTMTNCIIADIDGIYNNAGALSDIKLSFCDIFVDGDQYLPDAEFIVASDILNVDPLYVDAAGGDFTLQPGSPVATAGKDGSYMGSQGLESAIVDWMMQ
jgi:hypothetical protein